MKPMTLLKGFSEIDPQFIRAALDNAQQETDSAEAAQEQTELPVQAPAVTVSRKRPRFLFGAAAVAACAGFALAGMLFYRASRNDSLVQSSDNASDVCEVTVSAEPETTAPPQTDHTTETTALTTTVQTETASQPAEDATGIHLPVQGTEKTEKTAAKTQNTTETTSTAVTTTTTTAEPAPVTYPAQIPALVCLRDMGGIVQRLSDGLDANVREPVFEVITDAASINAYLYPANTYLEPPVSVGTGKKSAAAAAAIYADPVLLRVRWNEKQDTFLNEQWESYGIQSAEISADGILHLRVGVYNSNQPPADADAHWHVYTPEPMVYETSLLCEAGTVPQITGLDFQIQEFKEPSRFSVTEWMNFTASLSGDLYIANSVS